jgi:hypothetical protein
MTHRTHFAARAVIPVAASTTRSRIAVAAFRTRAVIALAAILAVTSAPGCKKVQADRQLTAAEKQADAAIEKYSAASAQANAAHQAVLQSFEQANHASDLTVYKQALREKVLPAMDAFVERLKAMPTGTPELKRIHGELLKAYQTARSEIETFEHELEGVDGLARFGDIRSRLQTGVRNYREALAAYYAANKRQLKLDARTGEASAPPASATATSLEPAAGATPTAK